jgi:hypothetical protein
MIDWHLAQLKYDHDKGHWVPDVIDGEGDAEWKSGETKGAARHLTEQNMGRGGMHLTDTIALLVMTKRNSASEFWCLEDEVIKEVEATGRLLGQPVYIIYRQEGEQWDVIKSEPNADGELPFGKVIERFDSKKAARDRARQMHLESMNAAAVIEYDWYGEKVTSIHSEPQYWRDWWLQMGRY